MIRLSLKALESFKKLYLEEYGVSLSDEDANRLGLELLQFVSLIYRPIPVKDSDLVRSWLDNPQGTCTLGSTEKKR